jgi:flagellar hook-basal body complex protein FliE
MDVKSSLAALNYAATKPATAPKPGADDTAPNPAADLARSFAATLAEGEAQARAAMTGGADPHALVQALAQTELAVETAVTLRNRVVEAYQEILRMPV